jgi:hypothetical protein
MQSTFLQPEDRESALVIVRDAPAIEAHHHVNGSSTAINAVLHPVCDLGMTEEVSPSG